jgi:pimeloyl-ACP methyl ester carboxylesterase
MIFANDDNLRKFEMEGAPSLPRSVSEGYIDNEGARIWYAIYGNGRPIVLLHGGLGNSGNWGYQVPSLVENGYKPIVIDTRGHGKSTRDDQPYSYQLLARDLKVVLDVLRIEEVGLVGWSDGAVTALIFADLFPKRVEGIVYFACNMDNSGVLDRIEFTPIVEACFNRHKIDYERLSEKPEEFNALVTAVTTMQKTQPNYSEKDLKRIGVQVLVVHSEHDEFIKQAHSKYLAETMPHAKFLLLQGVSHFAPLQRPELFNEKLLDFFKGINY